MNKPCISIRQVGKQFVTRSQTIEALRNVDLNIRPNEFVTLSLIHI